MDMIIIENVGNLICPAEYDTGVDIGGAAPKPLQGDCIPLTP